MAPTRENAQIMNMAQSGAPLSAQGAYEVAHNPNNSMGFSMSDFAKTPVTASEAAAENSHIGPQGKMRRRKQKGDVQQSDSNANDKVT